MARHRVSKPRESGKLLWTDWAFVFALTIVASAGAYAFVVILFERLGI